MGEDTRLSTTSSDTSSAATAEVTMQAVVQDTYGSADVCTEERLGERSSSPSEPQANPQRTSRRPGPAGYTTQETDHAYTAAINRAKPTQP